MSAQTADGFCEVLEKSELLTVEQLEQVRQSAAAGTSAPIDLIKPLIQQGLVTKWQAKILLAGRVGFKLGKYILLERLGKKESGDVYLAKHAQLGRKVAIKTLTKDQTEDRDQLKKYLASAREIAKLDHRNITRLYDIDREGSRFFLVMEQIDGRDLHSVIEESGPLPPDFVGNYILQAADGLAHAHEHGILHRSVTPANLLVDDEGVVKVLNLGVPQLHAPAGENGSAAENYLAPEVAGGNNGDQLADIFALGATGLYLLTGTNPKTNKQKPTTDLEKILRKMMLTKPENRVKSAAHVSKLLEKWLAQYEPQPEPTVVEADLEDLDQGLDGLSAIDQLDAIDESPVADDPLAATVEEDVQVGLPSPGVFASPFETQTAPTEADETKPTVQSVAGPSKRLSGGAIAGLAVGGGAAMLAFVTLFSGLLYLALFGSFVHAGTTDTISAESSEDSTVFGALTASTPKDSLLALATTFSDLEDVSAMDMEVDDAADEGPEGNDTADDNAVALANSPDTTGDTTKKNETDEDQKKDEGKAKPDDKPTPSKKPTPPKRQNPFRQLLPVVSLPETSSTDPISLGPLDTKPTDQILTDLVGGSMASRGGKPSFTMAYGNGGVSTSEFEFFMEGTGGDKTLVAKMAIQDKKLMFQWTSDAAKDNTANYLRNCVIAFTALGGETHSMTLRQPKSMDALTFDAKKSALNDQLIPLEWLPDTEHLRIELTLPKNFPPNKPSPGLDFAALDETTNINIGDVVGMVRGKDIYASFVRVDVTASSRVQIRGSLRVSTPNVRTGVITPQGYNEKALTGMIQAMDVAVRNKTLVDAEWKKIKNKNDRNQFFNFTKATFQKTGMQFRSPTEVQVFVGDLVQLRSSIDKMRKLPAQVQTILGSQIGVKIYFQTVDNDGLPADQVILAQSK